MRMFGWFGLKFILCYNLVPDMHLLHCTGIRAAIYDSDDDVAHGELCTTVTQTQSRVKAKTSDSDDDVPLNKRLYAEMLDRQPKIQAVSDDIDSDSDVSCGQPQDSTEREDYGDVPGTFVTNCSTVRHSNLYGSMSMITSSSAAYDSDSDVSCGQPTSDSGRDVMTW